MTRRGKYNAQPTWVDGHRFASALEAKRYGQLVIMLRAGAIRDLNLQPSWPLSDDIIRLEGLSKRGVRPVYTADFEYYDKQTQKPVIEEVKGVWTEAAKLRVRWWASRYPTLTKYWRCLGRDEI